MCRLMTIATKQSLLCNYEQTDVSCCSDLVYTTCLPFNTPSNLPALSSSMRSRVVYKTKLRTGSTEEGPVARSCGIYEPSISVKLNCRRYEDRHRVMPIRQESYTCHGDELKLQIGLILKISLEPQLVVETVLIGQYRRPDPRSCQRNHALTALMS